MRHYVDLLFVPSSLLRFFLPTFEFSVLRENSPVILLHVNLQMTFGDIILVI